MQEDPFWDKKNVSVAGLSLTGVTVTERDLGDMILISKILLITEGDPLHPVWSSESDV